MLYSAQTTPGKWQKNTEGELCFCVFYRLPM